MPGHSIQVAARQSGVAATLIRAWERRYQALSPGRTAGGHRVYSDADIARLRLLARATGQGHRISHIARLSDAELGDLLAKDTVGSSDPPRPPRDPGPSDSHRVLAECLDAVRGLDAQRLETLLNRAVVSLTPPTVVDHVIAPLMRQIGDLWWRGELEVSHEHVASAVVRNVLGRMTSLTQPDAADTRIVVCTPANQRHEIGAMLASATAAAQGWRVTYLGPDLPARDIVSAARSTRAQAVAMSLVYPEDDPDLPDELRDLRRELPDDVALLVGGPAASACADVLTEIGATVVRDLEHLREALAALADRSRAA